jgi:lipopolysaccharide transport system permease protein
MCFTFSISILLASLNVIYRDVRFALPFIIQALFFTTPVIFPINMVSEKYRWLLMLNPLVGIIEGFRASLFDYTINLSLFFYTIISTIVVFFFCFAVFVKLEKIFAERV